MGGFDKAQSDEAPERIVPPPPASLQAPRKEDYSTATGASIQKPTDAPAGSYETTISDDGQHHFT